MLDRNETMKTIKLERLSVTKGLLGIIHISFNPNSYIDVLTWRKKEANISIPQVKQEKIFAFRPSAVLSSIQSDIF